MKELTFPVTRGWCSGYELRIIGITHSVSADANKTPGWYVASLVLGSKMSRSDCRTFWRERVNSQLSWCKSAPMIQKYDTMEFVDRHWVETVVDGRDDDAFQDGLEKLFNYAQFGNDAGTVVPVSAPWGIIGTLENGEIQPKVHVFLMFVPELEIIPEPLDETIGIAGDPSNWFYVRAFEEKVEVEQYPELVTEFMKDLEKDNKKFDDTYFVVAIYSTEGLMEIGFKMKK